MEQHEKIDLYLDRDKAGRQATQQALKCSIKYFDKSHYYKYSKDLNEYMVKQHQQEHLTSHHRLRMKL